jgi:hypothetical protein
MVYARMASSGVAAISSSSRKEYEMPARLTSSLTVSVVTISRASGCSVIDFAAAGEPSRI